MTVRHLHPEPIPPMSERAESILPIIKDVEILVRQGHIRSIALVMVTEEGGVLTRWDTDDKDNMKVLSFCLASDFVACRDDHEGD